MTSSAEGDLLTLLILSTFFDHVPKRISQSKKLEIYARNKFPPPPAIILEP